MTKRNCSTCAHKGADLEPDDSPCRGCFGPVFERWQEPVTVGWCDRHGSYSGSECPSCATDRETFGQIALGPGAVSYLGGAKPSNPKDIVGSGKAPLSALPMRVLWNLGLGMLEGQCKYGRHNYRAVGVRASIYFDACMRHILSWWEGEDVDPDSGLNHVDKAIVSLMVLRDSMLGGNWTDDRPPIAPVDWKALHEQAQAIIERHKDKSPKHYTRSGE